MPMLILLAAFGFVAQLVDGSLGMGYGVTSTSLLVAVGVAPAAASAAVNFAQLGTTLASGVSHHSMGNVDWRTVSILAAPGFVGAFGGAFFLVSLSTEVAIPTVATILLVLGTYVFLRFLLLGGRRLTFHGSPSPLFLVPMGLVGGTVNSIGGGGWGPIGTTTLLSSGRLEPRKVVGSISTTEFGVTVGGSLGFLFALGTEEVPWSYTLALLIGGVIAAPFAAYLVRYLAPRVLGVAAGGMIILTNTRTLLTNADVAGQTIGLVLGALAVAWVAAIVVTVRQVRAERRAAAAEPTVDTAEPEVDPVA